MSNQERMEKIPVQKRAFNEGLVECINGDWIFFNKYDDEAFEINDLAKLCEVKVNGVWQKGKVIGNGVIDINDTFYYLKNGDLLRFEKPIQYSFKTLLEELQDDSFFVFLRMLNKLDYSLYDCIYCNNFLQFLVGQKSKKGVNFVIFDNEEMVCTVQHHFSRGKKNTDRFEFTLNDGQRSFCEKFSSL